MRVLGVIPARGGSKSIPRKNLVLLAGQPLITWTIKAAQGARRLDRLVVSTEDTEIAATSLASGAEVPFLRPVELAADETPTLPVIRHCLQWLESTESYRPDAVMILQATSPLRRSMHVDEAINLLEADTHADSLVSCTAVPSHLHPNKMMRRGDDGYLHPFIAGSVIQRRQTLDPLFVRNGAAIYLARCPLHEHSILGERILCYLMDPADSIDIDDRQDLERAEQILRARFLEQSNRPSAAINEATQ